MSWLALLDSVANGDLRFGRTIQFEASARHDIVVEERSFMAHLIRKSKRSFDAATRGTFFQDSDEDVGDSSAAQSRLLEKFKIVAAMRQVEWELYESRARELRRQCESDNSNESLELLFRMVNPSQRCQRQKEIKQDCSELGNSTPSPGSHAVAGGSVGGDASPGVVPPLSARPAPIERVALPPPAEISPSERIVLSDEGFSRATLIMEERSGRNYIRNALQHSLLYGDDEIRVKLWDKQWKAVEEDAREAQRRKEAMEKQHQEFVARAGRHRQIAQQQNLRVAAKRRNREMRLVVEEDESIQRNDIIDDFFTWFRTYVYRRHFFSVALAIPIEEAHARCTLESRESTLFAKVSRTRKMLQWLEGTYRDWEHRREEIYAESADDLTREILLYRKQLEEEEQQMKRRDILRQVEEREERERLMLELQFGASPLSLRPKSAPSGVNRFCLRPADRFQLLVSNHPPSSIKALVQRASRANQENNALYMAIDKRHLNKNAVTPGNSER
jgi:hypothetical protein